MRFFGILNMWRGWQKAFVQIAQRGIWSGWKPRKYWVFPHCMWGCIGRTPDATARGRVPSLYVRVYRTKNRSRWKKTRSLTVCEGVSTKFQKIKNSAWFPHCMWGCICLYSVLYLRACVPSLYVRVYRWRIRTGIVWQRSLTVCEGVSLDNDFIRRHIRFPHCMWGCIGFCSWFWRCW